MMKMVSSLYVASGSHSFIKKEASYKEPLRSRIGLFAFYIVYFDVLDIVFIVLLIKI